MAKFVFIACSLLLLAFDGNGQASADLAEPLRERVINNGELADHPQTAKSSTYLLLGIVANVANNTQARHLYDVRQHTGRAKLIGSIEEERFPGDGNQCLIAVNEANDVAFLFRVSADLVVMDLSDGTIEYDYKKGQDAGRFGVLFWNKTSPYYNLQGIHTFFNYQINSSEVCWARLVTKNNTAYGTECEAVLDNSWYVMSCVSQNDEIDQLLWVKAIPISTNLVFFVATRVNNSGFEGQVSYVWAGYTGLTALVNDPRDCYARDPVLKRTFGITRTNSSQQMIELMQANMSDLGKAPPPKHLLNLPSGLLLESAGACTYNITQHTFFLFMSGEPGDRLDGLGQRADNSHWLVTVDTESLELQTQRLSGLPSNFTAVQAVTTTRHTSHPAKRMHLHID